MLGIATAFQPVGGGAGNVVGPCSGLPTRLRSICNGAQPMHVRVRQEPQSGLRSRGWLPARCGRCRPGGVSKRASGVVRQLGAGLSEVIISGGLFYVLIKSFGMGNEDVVVDETAVPTRPEDPAGDERPARRSKARAKVAKERRSLEEDDVCLCGSERPYGQCCQPYHDDRIASDAESGSKRFAGVVETAEGVLRARFCAYALRDVEYIMASTSKANEDYVAKHEDREGYELWYAAIGRFCDQYGFFGLDIIDVQTMNVISQETIGAQLVNLFEQKVRNQSNDKAALPRSLVTKILFRANLMENGDPIYFIEESRFVRHGPRWKYSDGRLISAPRSASDVNSGRAGTPRENDR
ncbi:UPF0225 protein [Porphyridium purpureum]|uniref:UPF0225 protein n=1 Tax=Porphyridium purpureum TaxID=35688 RepID=A0A5J4YHP7_PORPP|nr:UPF0225 protein [Porphyridium purpureum]|eukprot:POR4060..scf289_17